MWGLRGAVRAFVLVLVAGAAVVPGVADASSIFFIRSNDIWVANPDGSNARQVTTDGGNGMPYTWVAAAKGPSTTLAFLRDNPAATPRQVFGTMNPDGTGIVENPGNASMQPSGLYDGMMVSIDNAGDRIAWPKSYSQCYIYPCQSTYAPYSIGVDGTNEQHVVVGEANNVTFGDASGQSLLFENIGGESSSFGGVPAGCGSSSQAHHYLIIRQVPAPDGGTPGPATFYCVNGIDLTNPALRPDGQAFAAVESSGSVTNSIVTIPSANAAGAGADSAATPVVSAASAAAPDFSPDGSQIAFQAAGKAIDTVPAAGGAPTQILSNATSPAWSPYTPPGGGTGATGRGGGTGGLGTCCTSNAQIRALMLSALAQLAHALGGRLAALTHAITLAGLPGERIDLALYLPPGRKAHSRRAAAARLGPLAAIDVEPFSAAGRATVHFAITKAGRRLLAHRRRTRLTLLTVVRDAHGHGLVHLSPLILH